MVVRVASFLFRLYLIIPMLYFDTSGQLRRREVERKSSLPIKWSGMWLLLCVTGFALSILTMC